MKVGIKKNKQIIDDISKEANYEIEKDYDINKDYRKTLGIPEDADEETIANICAAAFQYMKDKPLILEAATVLNNPKTRNAYDRDRAIKSELDKAEERRKNKEADAEIEAERRQKKQERALAKDKQRKENRRNRKLARDKKRIAKNIDREKIKIAEAITNGATIEEAQNMIKRKSLRNIIALIIVGVLVSGTIIYKEKDCIKEKIPTLFDKDDETLENGNITLDEEEVVIAANSKVEKIEYVKTFTDPSKEKQVKARAEAIINYFKANNFYDYTEEEIINQTKYFNGSYQVSSNSETYDAYGIQDSILTTFQNFKSCIIQNDTYINGVNENGNTVGSGLDAFLVDNSPNKEIVIEVFEKFKNLSTSKIAQEQVDAANEFIALEYELMNGLKMDSKGNYIAYNSMEPNEGFFIGSIFQLGNTICPSIIREDDVISYIDVNEKEIAIDFNEIAHYYNPKNGDEFDFDNQWVLFSSELIEQAESLKNSLN